ncbi:MAG: hypothetical protein K9K79_08000 [Desulfohalobiaceae bacterium]|nr:hypothetical protein [Desulfohalobiaceae bacterium]
MGLGAIRKALAGRLFPGTLTIHARNRYLFFSS